MEDVAISRQTADVTVHDPQHQGEGRQKFTSYLIEVKAPTASVCRRRYSDFQWLYDKLQEERAGCIIPIIRHTRALTPAKRFSEALLAERMGQLNWFLRKVLSHPDLEDSPSLKTFLEANQTEWDAIKKPKKFDEEGAKSAFDVASASADNNETNKVKDWMQKVRTKVALAGNTALESTPDDEIFNDIEAYVTNLETNIKVLHKGAETLVKSAKQSCDTMKQMGASFAEMGQYTLPNEVLVRTPSHTMFKKIGSNWNNLAKLSGFQQSSTVTKLEAPLEEMMRDVISARISLTKRKELLYNYTRKQNDTKKKQGQLHKLREKAGMPDNKSINLEAEIRTLKDEGAEIWKDVDNVSKRLSRDIERFKMGMKESMRSTLEKFHSVQTEYAKKFVKGWEEVLPILETNDSKKKDESSPASLSSDNNAPITTSV